MNDERGMKSILSFSSSFIVPRLSFILVLALVCVVGLALACLFVALRSRRGKKSAGNLSLINRTGSVIKPLNPEGAVMVGGELWRARTSSGERVACGEANVRVVGARGHLLEVEPTG
jgi:membrane-bound ClpP family serine protease